MNSKGHLFISLAKSVVRIAGGGLTLLTGSVLWVALGICIAEIGGIAEELVDKR